MFCKNCGKSISDEVAFCPECGTPCRRGQQSSEDGNVQQSSSDKAKKAPGRLAPILIIGALLIAVIIVMIMASSSLSKLFSDKEDASDGGKDKSARELDIEEQQPLYSIGELPVIDTYAQNYVPNPKQQGVRWDSTLFYWLEDIDQTSSEDGYLTRCHISKTLLQSAGTGKVIQYEIYRDPETAVIYKIVSIEEKNDGLELTDYYYDQAGKVNFIFQRDDSVYTPTYATPSKVGERYYFYGDMMARWRIIREPNVIGEYVLTPTEGGASYSQADYFAETAKIQGYYDDAELKMLNAAYNTYQAVSEQTIGMVEGVVKDTTGTPVADVTVDILRTSDDVLLYRGTTGADGAFRILTYLDDTECYMLLRGNETFQTAGVYGMLLSSAGVGNTYNNLLLHRVGGDEYPLHMNIFAATEVQTAEDGSLIRNAVQGTSVTFRSGTGAYSGEAVATAEADAEGKINVNLLSGTYTAEIEAPGYSVSYQEVEVSEQETALDSYVLPAVAEGQTGVVLTWEDAAYDLDLTLFTPWQDADGDMAHVGAAMSEDGHGNRLLADNKSGCEVLYVNTAELGSYKLYVNNYTDSLAGNYTSQSLSGLNIRIYLYDSNGFVAEYTFPVGQIGVVWEVVELNGGRQIPSNRVYSSVEGKSWWTAEKGAASEEELLAALQEGTNLRRLLDDMVHCYIDDGTTFMSETRKRLNSSDAESRINRLCSGNVESLLEFWGLTFEVAPHTPPVETYDSSKFNYTTYSMTKEQMSYAAYSLTGQNISFDFMDTNERWDGTGIAFGGCAGDESYNYVDDLTVEYAGNGIYKVFARVFFGTEYEPDFQVAELTFLITGNPDSCYEGFRVAGVEKVQIFDNTEWMEAYSNYLSNHSEFSQWVDGLHRDYRDSFEPYFYLLYVDDDVIPEIYILGTCTAEGDRLLFYHDGQVYEEYLSNYGGSYVPYSGRLLHSGGRMGGYWDEVYQLTEGQLTMIEYGSYDYFDEAGYEVRDETGEMVLQHVEWNGQEVSTLEEYEALKKEAFDSDGLSRSCFGGERGYDARDMGGDIDYMLELLRYRYMAL